MIKTEILKKKKKKSYRPNLFLLKPVMPWPIVILFLRDRLFTDLSRLLLRKIFIILDELSDVLFYGKK